MKRRHAIAPGARGFTLMEIMVTLSIASIIGAVVFDFYLQMHRGFLRQMENMDARQNARAAIDALVHHIRQAGFGMVSHVDSRGVVPVGRCANVNTVPPSRNSIDACDGARTDGSDALRVVYGDATGFVSRPRVQVNPDLTIAVQEAGAPTPPGHPLCGSAGSLCPVLGLISGTCEGGGMGVPNFGADVLAVSGTPDNYTLLEPLDANNGTLACGSSAALNYLSGSASFARANVIDFYLDRAAGASPQLMMRTVDAAGTTTGQVVAFDIDDFQVRYGFDTDTLPDGKLGAAGSTISPWCDDPRRSGGTTPCPIPFASIQEAYARIIAVQVFVVARTRHTRTEIGYARSSRTPTTLRVANHDLTTSDDYGRWIFRATIGLRNHAL